MGDPLETAAIGRVFGEKGVYIGSVSGKMTNNAMFVHIKIGETQRGSLGRCIRHNKPNQSHTLSAIWHDTSEYQIQKPES